ncbi:hypothetical protein H0H81_007706 [Sphagnurus paluster]|uniref:Cleavage stimulation factor subunit 2 hinge domain-containing protein n=1 Tax=Sphagnurus paluster TaxID=117069 RepID=A0A9P7K4W7_9AGAR|nr:hypothetical protein H0H81_007706 [Sphagnurus paluster]
MSNQSFAAEQLLELLLQLKKTTPTAARSILNGQPQIAYALMTLMVTMNAVNFDVFQKTLAEFGSSKPTPTATSASSTPAPVLPPHLQPPAQPYRTATPQSQPYPYSNGHGGPQQPQAHAYGQAQPQYPPGYGYNQPQPSYNAYPGYGAPAPAPPSHNPSVANTLAAIPEEQKVRMATSNSFFLS